MSPASLFHRQETSHLKTQAWKDVRGRPVQTLPTMLLSVKAPDGGNALLSPRHLPGGAPRGQTCWERAVCSELAFVGLQEWSAQSPVLLVSQTSPSILSSHKTITSKTSATSISLPLHLGKVFLVWVGHTD